MSRSPNKLLASLSAREYRRIASRLHTIGLSNGTALPDCGVGRVYFPGTGVSSILSRMSDGTIEVASVGREGVVGMPALGSQLSASTYLQVAHGSVQYMPLNVFESSCVGSELGRAVDRFCGIFMQSVMQLAACNRLHPMEARCARWILLTHERLGRARFELTQPFLAMTVGAAPNELARFMAQLAERGIVKHDAATLTILDPTRLRRLVCSCYAGLRKHAATPARVRPARTNAGRAKVLPMRAAPVCTLCGLGRDYPHKTHADCLRALNSDVQSLVNRAKDLLKVRGRIALESIENGKFVKRQQS